MAKITFFDTVTSSAVAKKSRCPIITAAERAKGGNGKYAGMSATDVLIKLYGKWDDDEKNQQKIDDRKVLKDFMKGGPAQHKILKDKHSDLLKDAGRRKFAFFQVGDGANPKRGFFVALCAVCNVALAFKASNALERVKCDECKPDTSKSSSTKMKESEKIQATIDALQEDKDTLLSINMDGEAAKIQASIDKQNIKLKDALAKEAAEDN